MVFDPHRDCSEIGFATTVEDPPGEVGLLQLRSGIEFEYHGAPQRTAESHVGDYFVPGDMGYLDEEGYLFLVDRRTDLIISGGVNIYPAEIEEAILEHSAVLDAVVIGVTEPEWGQSVVALVQPRPEWTDPGEIRATLLEHCRGKLAKFKVPRVVEVVDELPRTPAGKINRGSLRVNYENSTRT